MNCFGFALLHSVIGSKFSRHFLNQSEVKPKPIVARTCTFSRALCRLCVIPSSCDWFTELSPSFFIGQSNYFGSGCMTLDWNSLFELILFDFCTAVSPISAPVPLLLLSINIWYHFLAVSLWYWTSLISTNFSLLGYSYQVSCQALELHVS